VIIYNTVAQTSPFYSNVEVLYSAAVTPTVIGSISGVFGINLCSGELYIAKAGIIDYRAFDPSLFPGSRVSPYQRKVIVRAIVGNKPDVYTDVVVTINILRAIKPPAFLDPTDNSPVLRTFRSVAENYVGTFDTPVAATAFEPNPITYDIIFGNSLGYFSVNNRTGQLSVAKLGLNFENPDLARFEIMVRARDSVYPDKSAIVLVEVTVTDAEDAPYAENPQSFKLSESRAGNGLLLGSVKAFDEDIGDMIKFSVDRVAAGDRFNYLQQTFYLNETNGQLTLTRTLYYDPELSDVKVVDGLQVREAFVLPVLVTDTYGPKSTPFNVVIYILANLTTGPEPMFELIRAPGVGCSTKGNDTVVIGGQNFDTILNNNNNITDVWVNFTTQDTDPTTIGAYCNPNCVAYCDPQDVGCVQCDRLRCPRTYQLKGCYIVDPSGIICQTVPGYGLRLVVQVRHGKLRKRMLSPAAAVFVDYAVPSVVSVRAAAEPGKLPDNPAALPTKGSSSLILTVNEMGPQGNAIGYLDARLTVLYGKNFEYRAQVIVERDRYNNLVYPDLVANEIKILTTTGIGRDLPFKVIAGLQESPENSLVTISYAPPTISSIATTVAGGSISALSTLGTDSIIITGDNFGPFSVFPEELRYTSAQSVPIDSVSTPVLFSYTPVCTKSNDASAHTRITCQVQPGAGRNHAVVITVGNQTARSVAPNLLSYLAPVVTSADGEGTFLADTQGGQKVNLKGQNLGPLGVIGDGYPGSINFVPLSITYGPTGVEYVAAGCAIASSDASIVSCLTAPGTGKGHVWNINVGGQASPLLRANTSYAPPVITAFERTDIDPATGLPFTETSFLTQGSELVLISGKNFGPSIVNGKFDAVYTLSLRDNKTAYDTFVGGDSKAQITFSAAACSMPTPHFQLLCRTTPGAGSDLSWTITVDSQPSTQPVVAYGAPVVSTVRDINSQPIPGSPGTAGVSTDGGDTLVLTGKNFGPAINCKTGGWTLQQQQAGNRICHGFIQQVRYGRTGVEYSVADFDVVNHNTLYVKVAPGFGKELRFRIVIAGQASELSAEAFSYRSPLVTSVSPFMADTDPSASKVIKIRVEGYDFSLLDPSANVGIVFGNDGDRTLRPGFLRVVDRFPDWQDAASVASYVPGSKHWVTFQLVEGLLDMRAVRVAVYTNGQASGYQVRSDPTFDAAYTDPANPTAVPTVFFTYNRPVIDTVSVSIVNTSDTDFVRWIINNVKSVNSNDIPNLYVVTLIGSNFGPNSTTANDAVVRAIEYKPYDDQGLATWTTLVGATAVPHYTLYKWNHNTIVSVTRNDKGKIRVAATGTFFDGSPDVYGSDPYLYADVSPVVNRLLGSSGPFATAGGDVISFEVTNLKSARSVSVTVGGRRCPIATAQGIPVADAQILADIIRNSDYYEPDLTDINRVWSLYCILPAGQGLGQQLIVQRDEVFSDTPITVDYLPPRVDVIRVHNANGQRIETYNFVPGQPLTISVDTEPTLIEMQGDNFGICPVITAGAAMPRQLGLRQDRCGTTFIPSNYTLLAATFHTHQYMRITTEPGEGSGLLVDPTYGFRINLDVSGQNPATYAGSVATSQVLKFRYTLPSITSVTATGRTAGGDTITIQGLNFGSTTPSVTIGQTGAGQPGDLPCTNVTYDRRTNPRLVRCTLAEGSGGGLLVKVTVGDQTTPIPGNFSYLTPSIASVRIDSSSENGTVVSAVTVLGSGASRVKARGPTAGGYNVTLVGDNFGAFDLANHCLFVAWRGERLELPVVCNGAVDFVGENEVPDFAIVAWNHTAITFVMPPGAGVREIFPFVRSQRPTPYQADGLVWFYNTPRIVEGISPNHGPTSGGTTIFVSGSDFGQAPIDSTDPANQPLMTAVPTRLEDYLTRAQAPQQILTVEFFRSCMSSHHEAANANRFPPIIQRCKVYENRVTGHTHSLVKFLTPPYIGVNRSVTVTIHDWVFDFDANVPRYINFTSPAAALFTYDAPSITMVNPTKVRMNGEDPSKLTLTGDNYGDVALWTDSCQWTPQERLVRFAAGGETCVPSLDYNSCPGDVEPARAGPVNSKGAPAFDCILQPTTVGRKNLTYSLVGQTKTNPVEDVLGSVFTVCAATFFGKPGETCSPCPFGARCAGFDDLLRDPTDNQSYIDRGVHTYPRPQATFYNMNSSDSKSSGMYETCPEQIADEYPGRDVCVVACSPPEACLGDNVCAYGYRSVAPYFRCATCDIGFYKRTNECVKCPDSPWALVIGFTMLVMVGGGLAYWLNKHKINLAFISIGIDYFQVLAIFAQSKVAWPPIIKELFHILSAFNLNIEIVAPECIVPDLAYKSKWSFIMALPLAIAFFFLLITLAQAFSKGVIRGQKVKIANEISALASSVLLLMYVMYIYLTRNVLDIFNCSPTDPPDGRTYLTAVFEECGIPGGTQDDPHGRRRRRPPRLRLRLPALCRLPPLQEPRHGPRGPAPPRQGRRRRQAHQPPRLRVPQALLPRLLPVQARDLPLGRGHPPPQVPPLHHLHPLQPQPLLPARGRPPHHGPRLLRPGPLLPVHGPRRL
jgi:hypothetical protein